MDLSDGPEHLAFREQLRSFLKANRHLAPTETAQTYRLNPRPYSPTMRAWQKLLVHHGYACRTVPRDYGGFGARPDAIISKIITDEFFAADLPQGLISQGISMLVPTLLEHGTEAQKAAYIEKTIGGDIFWCQGYSEPQAGSDLASLQTRAMDAGDKLVINGQKIWTSSAQIAHMMFCLARTEADKPRHAGISYLIFPMDLPGIEVRPLMTMTGHPSFNEVFFTELEVPKDAIVGGRGNGWRVANSTLSHERGMLGSANGAIARLNRIGAMLRARTHETGSPADNILIHDRFIRLQARVESLRAHDLRLTSAAARGEPPGLGEMVCKLLGCELNYDLDMLAIDLAGESGILHDPAAAEDNDAIWQQMAMYDLGLIIGGGTAQIQKNIISERGLGMPREPRLSAPGKD